MKFSLRGDPRDFLLYLFSLRIEARRLIFSMSFLLVSIYFFFFMRLMVRWVRRRVANSSLFSASALFKRLFACFQRRPILMRRTRRITRVSLPARVPMRAPRPARASYPACSALLAL